MLSGNHGWLEEPRLKVRAALSRNYKDCKKTHGLITLLISKVTNYKMPERLVLTNIPVVIPYSITSAPLDWLTTEHIHLVEFLEPRLDLRICGVGGPQNFENAVIPEDMHKTGRAYQSTVRIWRTWIQLSRHQHWPQINTEPRKLLSSRCQKVFDPFLPRSQNLLARGPI